VTGSFFIILVPKFMKLTMKKLFFTFTFGLTLILVTSCNLTGTQINQLSDKEDGEKIANNLFSALRDNNYKSAERLFGKEFFSATPKDSLYIIFRKTREHLGEFKGNKLIDWRTNEISGTINKTEYLLVYEVEYDKHKSSETISMLKKGDNGPIKIIGYHVQSNGFPF